MAKKNLGEGNDWTEGNIKFLWLDTEVGLGAKALGFDILAAVINSPGFNFTSRF